jgi:hypothetical protein
MRGMENVRLAKMMKEESNRASMVTMCPKVTLISTDGEHRTQIVVKFPDTPKIAINGRSKPSKM